jgi:hypothetical protein
MTHTKYKTISDLGIVKTFDGLEDARIEQTLEQLRGHSAIVLNLNPPKAREN